MATSGTRAMALALVLVLGWGVVAAGDQKPSRPAKPKAKAKPTYVSAKDLPFPPSLSGGREVATDRAPEFLSPADTLRDGVAVAQAVPTIDFGYFPGQTYQGSIWSNWGDSIAVGDKYYASIGDHDGPEGNAFVYQYDPATKRFRQLLDLRKLLSLPAGHYTPGKIHSRLDMGADGWLYCSTHRGSPRKANDECHYQGDWVIRCHPESGKAEVVVQAPVPKHSIPTSVLDPQRLIFYGGTAQGEDSKVEGIQFFAYDVQARRLLYSGPNGPGRYMILAQSTGRIYFNPANDESRLMRYDPASGQPPHPVEGSIGIRAATTQTPQGFVYAVSTGHGGGESLVYRFDVKTERIETLGPAAVGANQYVATLDVDPSGRYLYYVPGAHGGSERDNSAVVQFDVQTGRRKVIAFLHPFYEKTYGCIPKGTYSVAVDPTGQRLFVTWNVSRGTRAWDCCALSVIHIPDSERPL